MNLILKNNYTLNFTIFLVIFGTTVFGYLLNNESPYYIYLWPAAGFSFGIYFIHSRQSLYGISLGLIAGHILCRITLFDEELWMSIFFGLFIVIIEVLSVILFRKIMQESKALNEINISNSLIFITSVFISCFAYAAITGTVYLLFTVEGNFFLFMIQQVLGRFLAGLLFATVILLSYFYDDIDSKIRGNVVVAAIYIALFMIISFLIFYPFNEGFTFNNFKYLYLLLFMIPVFVFSFRMLLFTGMVFLGFAHGFYLNSLPDLELGPAATEVYFFIFVMLLSAAAIRAVFLETRKKQTQLEVANLQLEDIIESTYQLLRLGEQQQFQQEFVSADYLKDLFDVATKIFNNYDKASCYYKGEEFVVFVGADGYDLEYLNNFQFRIEDFEWSKEVPEHVIESKNMVKQSLKNRYSKFIERNEELGESIKFSIFLDRGLVGGISFDITEGSDKKFTKQDYDNIQSFQRIMNSFYQTRFLISKNNSLRDEIVLSLIRTLELYDQYTGGHSEEVAHLAMDISKRMGLSESDQYNIFWAGIVHDIGKVGIPSEILNKPGRLSLEEYSIIKSHPVFGYDILKRSEDLSVIALLVKHHHEWWNGAGYPDGLIEDKIPLGAQIIGVADAVSSMATKRPYTEIKTSQEILRELKLYKGSQFAPDACDEMIKYIEDGFLDSFYLDHNTIKKG